MKGLRCNSLSCSSSISEVTTGPKQQHKDARWIRGLLSFYPSLHPFQSQHVLCTGIQKADDRRPNHTGSFSLSLFSFLTVTYPDVGFFFRSTFFLLLHSDSLEKLLDREDECRRGTDIGCWFSCCSLVEEQTVSCRFDFSKLEFSKFKYVFFRLSPKI